MEGLAPCFPFLRKKCIAKLKTFEIKVGQKKKNEQQTLYRGQDHKK
jgi:hypothetical protein